MNARVLLFQAEIDAVTLDEAANTVLQWAKEESSSKDRNCRFVVTPNVDHTVMLQESSKLRDVYADAHLVLADGWPVVAASRFLGCPLPERVAGSDLVPRVFSNASDEVTVFLLGAMPGVADQAKQNIHRQWPHVKVVGTYSPRFGFEKDERENASILQRIEEAKPDLLVVGLGAPKQEYWVHQHHHQISAKVALCVGATIDFLAGAKPRAPRWMQKSGLEFLHRVASEPKRLFKRYTKDAWIFPQLVWREWRAGAR